MWWARIRRSTCGVMVARMRSRLVLGSARSPASPSLPTGDTSKCGWVASHSMWLAARIARGPKRAPGRLVTAPSHATPATAYGCEGVAAGDFRKLLADRKAKLVMVGYWLAPARRGADDRRPGAAVRPASSAGFHDQDFALHIVKSNNAAVPQKLPPAKIWHRIMRSMRQVFDLSRNRIESSIRHKSSESTDDSLFWSPATPPFQPMHRSSHDEPHP
jgi:hypothetical protein